MNCQMELRWEVAAKSVLHLIIQKDYESAMEIKVWYALSSKLANKVCFSLLQYISINICFNFCHLFFYSQYTTLMRTKKHHSDRQSYFRKLYNGYLGMAAFGAWAEAKIKQQNGKIYLKIF